MEKLTNTKNRKNALVATLTTLALGAGVFVTGERTSGKSVKAEDVPAQVFGPHYVPEGPKPPKNDPNTTPAGVPGRGTGSVEGTSTGSGGVDQPADQTPDQYGFLPHEAGQPADEQGFLHHEERP